MIDLRQKAVAALVACSLALWVPVRAAEPPPRVAPFTAVRWHGEVPEVRVEGKWYGFESLDGLAARDILAAARRAGGEAWRTEFCENLVEVLGRMGYKPGGTVYLTLTRNGKRLERTARMSEENLLEVLDFNDRTAPAAPTNVIRTESDPFVGLALQFAAWIDRIWELPPVDGRANLRFLVRRDGRPFAGKISMRSEFTFLVRGGRGSYISQGLVPNASGRWIYEGLAPGDYHLSIEGLARFAGWSWSRSITVAPGDNPLFEIDLDR